MTLSAGNVTRMVASYSYDDIGRLVSLKRSGNVGMVNYAYNIRNWLNETKSDFIFEDGKLDKYLFDGGYCSFDNNQNPTFHYYEKDHLGSIRMVVNENGTIEQVNHYYQLEGYMETCHIIANTKRASTSARSSTTCMGWIGMTMVQECMMQLG